jgi:MFS superfamily sulfate permease-like transporter
LAAMLVPQALAYSTMMGVSPMNGLQSAFFPVVVYMVMGNSRQLSIGPEAITSILTASALDAYFYVPDDSNSTSGIDSNGDDLVNPNSRRANVACALR